MTAKAGTERGLPNTKKWSIGKYTRRSVALLHKKRDRLVASTNRAKDAKRGKLDLLLLRMTGAMSESRKIRKLVTQPSAEGTIFERRLREAKCVATPSVIPPAVEPQLEQGEDAKRFFVDKGKLAELVAIRGPELACGSSLKIPGEAAVPIV